MGTPLNNYLPGAGSYRVPSDWTNTQSERAAILFDKYPDIRKAYALVNGLRKIFNDCTSIEAAYTRLAHWYRKIEASRLTDFNTVVRSITLNYRPILNYFINRSTNASAESYNARIKAFRLQFRGVKNVQFFLYRLTRIFA